MEVDKFEYVGVICKQKRKRKNLTRKQASELSGISQSWIQKFENSKHKNFVPSLPTVEKYCNFLNMKLEITINIINL